MSMKALGELALGDILFYPDNEMIGVSIPLTERIPFDDTDKTIKRTDAYVLYKGIFHLWFVAHFFVYDTTQCRQLACGVGHRRYDHIKESFMINPNDNYNDYETFLKGNVLELWMDVQSTSSLEEIKIYTV